MTTLKSVASIAASAALLAISTGAIVSPARAAAKTVHCYGVNTCKGTSDCKSYNHDCKGLNSCKGMGFKEESKKACAAAGGSLTETPAPAAM
jgi:uncharacterized membrane protein